MWVSQHVGDDDDEEGEETLDRVVCHVHVEGLVPRWIERLLLRLGLVRLTPVCYYAVGIGEPVPAVSVDW